MKVNGVVAGVAGLLVALFAAALAMRKVEVALLLALLLVCWGFGVVLMALRRQTAAIRQSVELQKTHHKKASQWDWRLTDGLRAAGVIRAPEESQASEPVPVTVPEKPRGAGWKNHPDVERLSNLGIFDHEYYAAVSNAVFFRPADASSHYLSVGMRSGTMPTPLLDAAELPGAVRRAMTDGDIGPLVVHLRGDGALGRLSDWFDGRCLGAPTVLAKAHPGGPLGFYLTTATDGSPLPVPDSSPQRGLTLGDARGALIDAARTFYDSRLLMGRRNGDVWDFETERQWIETLESGAQGFEPMRTVSVIMPVLNRIDSIEAAVRSVLNQTYSRWELVVVDDGSDDGTLELVQRLVATDSRITVVRNPGRGVSSARNTGLRIASGDVVAFLDSDNEWTPRFLELSVRAMERDGLSACYSATISADAGPSGGEVRAFDGGLEHLMVLNHIDLNVLVVDRLLAEQVEGFDEELRRWVDHDFAIRVARLSVPRLLPFVGCVYDDSDERTDRITKRESDHWQWVVLGKAWVDWPTAAARDRVTGLVSVVIPTYNDAEMTIKAVDAVLADSSHRSVEVVVVDNGSNLAISQRLVSALVGRGAGRVRLLRLPRNLNFAIGSNFGAAHARGEFILFLNNDTVVRDGTISSLVEGLSQPETLGVQPLLVYPDETIQSAGTVFSGRNSLPSHLFAGHPVADASRTGSFEFAAVTAAAFMVKADQLVEARGFDPIFVNGMEDVDLCLRMRAIWDGAFRVVPSAKVIHFESKTPGRSKNQTENRRIFLDRWNGELPEVDHGAWEAAGFRIAHLASDDSPIRAPRPVLARALSAAPRWGLKIASIPGMRGDLWGDTHFGESLAGALRRQGQDAVLYRHGSHEVPASMYDDVVLVIRGLDRVRAMPGKINVLWVISHPELVTSDEIDEFDLVYVASVLYAEQLRARGARDVRVLLQATDRDRFNTAVEPSGAGGALFVGGNHAGRERKVVTDAIDAGCDLRVYGPGWEGTLPEGVLCGAYIENDQLAAFYRGAGVVLADHWPEMRESGFMQNRIFDAVAAGARVVTDPVAGLEIFGGAAVAYESLEHLAAMCASGSERYFPSDAEMVSLAARVRGEHSFDARAAELVRDVEGLTGRGVDA